MTTSTEQRLAALEEQVRDEMARIEAVAPCWLQPGTTGDGRTVHNVVICGAGLSGLSIAFGLRRRGINGLLVIDQAEAGREGPWVTHARMKTLRSPKHLAGPDFGIPALTPRSWFEALRGPDAWSALDRIDRCDFMDYLVWYRRVTGTEVRNDTRLVGIDRDGDRLALALETADGRREEVLCRRLVLATGIDGCGGPNIPPELAGLPKTLYTHSAECGSAAGLAGRDVAILGSATSSFDWAVTALEAGAGSVTMLARAPDLGRTEVLAWTNFPGFLGHFADLPDTDRWRFSHLYHGFRIPPTQDQYDRARRDERFRMELGLDITAIAEEAGRVVVTTDRGVFRADHLLLGTGYAVDLGLRRELAPLAERIALWQDRYRPPAGLDNAFLGRHPYLGPGFELMPKHTGSPDEDWLTRIHLFNGGAVPSMGPVCNGVTGLKYGLLRIVEALVAHLFREETPRLLVELAAYDVAHFDPRLGEAAE